MFEKIAPVKHTTIKIQQLAIMKSQIRKVTFNNVCYT